MPSAKRGNKAGPSNASSSTSTSSAAPQPSKSATTAASSSPSKRVIASLRRLPSQFLSAFSSSSPSSTSSSSSKGKRKAEDRERVATPLKGKARATDPPLDTPTSSSAVLAAEESSSSPAQKRARIAAPEALGREESRRLLALLDSPARSEHDWQMISVEEDDGGNLKRLEQDPAKDLEDDDEVAGLLGEMGTNSNGDGSGKRESELSQGRSASESGEAASDPTEPLLDSEEVNGTDTGLAQPKLGEVQEIEAAQHEDGSNSAEPAASAVSEQPMEESAKDDVAASLKDTYPGAQPGPPITGAASSHSDAEAQSGSTSLLPSHADVSMEEMVEDVSAPISSATFPASITETADEQQVESQKTVEKEQPEQDDELLSSIPEPDRLETTDSTLASGLPNGDVVKDTVVAEVDEDEADNNPLEAADGLPEISVGVGQAADAAVESSPDGETLEAEEQAQEKVLSASALLYKAPIELRSDLQEAPSPLSPPAVNGHVDTPPLYPALPVATDPEVSQEISRDSLSLSKHGNASPVRLQVASADALTEDVEPVESEMLEAEQPSFEQEIIDAVFAEPAQAPQLPHKVEQEATEHLQEETILIPALSQEAEDALPPAADGVAAHTTELGEAEDVIVPSDLETEVAGGEAPVVPALEAGEGEVLDGDELNEADEDEVEDEEIDELDAGSLLPTNSAVEVIDFTAEDSSEDEDEIVVPPPQSRGPSSTVFNRTPSSGLLRGPLSRAPRDASSPVSNADSSVSDTIRALGRASLNPRSPSSASSMSAMFDAQRYHKSARKVTPSSYSVMAKRPHIFEASHKARVRGKAQKEIGALKVIFQKNAVWLSRKGFKTSEQLGGWLEYKKLLGERISTTTGPPREKTAVLQLLNNDGSDLERKLRRLLGKSATSDSRISIKPGKEQKRLRREALAKERLRRGILGRPPLPKSLTAEQEAQVASVLSDYSWKVSVPGATASNRDVAMLRPGQWMNDETITFYMTMINQRSTRAEEERAKPNHDKRWNAFYRVHAFNSHFWAKIDQVGYSAVARWTRKVDVFSKDLILVPCNLGNSHWTCAAVNLRRKRIEYYDSMAGENRRVTSKLREYLKKEMADKKKDGVIDLNEFTDYFASDSSPQQRNGFDCGVFVCAALEQLSRRDPSHPSFEEDPPVLSLQEENDDDESSEEDEEDEEEEEQDDYAQQRMRRMRRRNRGDGYEWNFGQENMPYMRRRIIYEISQRALLD